LHWPASGNLASKLSRALKIGGRAWIVARCGLQKISLELAPEAELQQKTRAAIDKVNSAAAP
jgi:hypothetical protein